MRSMNDATTAELATPVGRVGVREGGTGGGARGLMGLANHKPKRRTGEVQWMDICRVCREAGWAHRPHSPSFAESFWLCSQISRLSACLQAQHGGHSRGCAVPNTPSGSGAERTSRRALSSSSSRGVFSDAAPSLSWLSCSCHGQSSECG